jgi:hypothetical protein
VDDTTDSQEHTPKRSSVALFPTTDEPFHIIEPDEVQPAIDDVPTIPDDPNPSSMHLPIPPMPVAEVPNFEDGQTPIPPMPDAVVPKLDVPPPVPDKLPTVQEGDDSAANVPLPPSDDRTLPPPPDEWVQVPADDPPNRKSYADTDISPPASVLAGGRNSLITRADLLREQADEEDKIRAHLENELKKLKSDGNVKESFLLKTDIEEAESRAKRLHAQAERRYFHAYNENSTPFTIDVQKLKVPEAIRRTENAIRDVLLQGGTLLRVVTDGTVLNATHLAIIKAMQDHKIHAEQDQTTSTVVVITLPKA